MSDTAMRHQMTLCPECKGRGMIRPPGEWANETCPACEGRGEIPEDASQTSADSED